jgi:hypothetical protein
MGKFAGFAPFRIFPWHPDASMARHTAGSSGRRLGWPFVFWGGAESGRQEVALAVDPSVRLLDRAVFRVGLL